MGYIYKVKCDKCGAEDDYLLGQGKRDFDIDSVSKNFKDEHIKNVLIEAENSGSWVFNRRLGVCRACNKLNSMATISVFEKDGCESIYIDGACSCGKEIIEIIDIDNEGMVDVTCSRCKSGLTGTRVGFWD